MAGVVARTKEQYASNDPDSVLSLVGRAACIVLAMEVHLITIHRHSRLARVPDKMSIEIHAAPPPPARPGSPIASTNRPSYCFRPNLGSCFRVSTQPEAESRSKRFAIPRPPTRVIRLNRRDPGCRSPPFLLVASVFGDRAARGIGIL